SGYLTSAATPAAQGGGLNFAIAGAGAASAAVRDFAHVDVPASQFVAEAAPGGYTRYAVPAASSAQLDEAVRVQPVYFHLTGGLQAGYYVEVIGRMPGAAPGVLDLNGPGTTPEAYSYVISATDGTVLFRNDLSADAFTYRVWADPATMVPNDTPAGNGPHPKA